MRLGAFLSRALRQEALWQIGNATRHYISAEKTT